MRWKVRTANILVLCLILCSSCIACSSNSKEEGKGKAVIIEYVDNTYYKVTLNYDLVKNHRQMGESFGKEIHKVIPNYEEMADRYLSIFTTGKIPEKLITYTQSVLSNIDKDYMDEIDGFADQMSGKEYDFIGDGKLSRNEVYLMNSIVDSVIRPSACSACAVYGSRTTDGKCIVGRNSDWPPTDELKSFSTVMVFKQGKKSFCSIGVLGYMGILTGFNDDSIYAAILDSSTMQPDSLDQVRSYPFDLRYCLENYDTMSEVGDYMTDFKHDYFREHIIFLADTDTSNVIENNIRGAGSEGGRKIRTEDSKLNPGVTWGIEDSVASVNSFALEGNINLMTKSWNSERWESFKRLLNEKTSEMDIDDIQDVMSFTNVNGELPGNQSDGSIYNRNTYQSILFKPSDMTLRIAFAPKGRAVPVVPTFIDVPVSFK
jgi:hypothetical protein